MGFWKEAAQWAANPIAKGWQEAGAGIETGLRGMGHNNLADKLWGKRGVTVNPDNFDKNAQLQREFAQNSIRWKVNDAKSAGIHPVYALGASGTSFSPMYSVGSTEMADDNRWLAEAGQSIAGAIGRTATTEQKQMQALALENAQLDNEMKKVELMRMKAGTPGIQSESGNFMPGQGDSGGGLVTVKPAERTVSAPGRPAQEAGWKPDVGYARTDTGLVPVVPEGLSESMEDDIIGKAMWRWRNQVVPNVDPLAVTPPRSMLPKGYNSWQWSVLQQEWQPSKEYPYHSMKNKPYNRDHNWGYNPGR